MTTAEEWLCEIMGCGIADIHMLDDVKFDIARVLRNAKNMGYDDPFELNTVLASAVDLAKSELQVEIDKRLHRIMNEKGYDDAKRDPDYIELSSLDPYEDIGEWHNYLDTNVYFEKNEELYRKHLYDECIIFESMTGLPLFD